jgi:chemotaxis family two-component system response regulator PixG
MLTSESTTIAHLLEELDRLCQQMAIGQLILTSHAREGQLHLFYGRLLYATGDFHRVRRWQRAIQKYAPHWQPRTQSLSLDPDKPWEYQLLYDGIETEQLTLAQAKSIIQIVALELLFSLSRYTDAVIHWEAHDDAKSELSLGLALSLRELATVVTKAEQLGQKWHDAGFENLSPNLTPVYKKAISPTALSGWGKYLNGKYTLWDISARTRKSIVTVTKMLLPLVKKGLVQFRHLKDLPNPVLTPTEPAPSLPQPDKGLIVCIDDSPTITQVLEKIVQSAGYKIIGIQDPVLALAKVAEYKPDLIFLDLVMPNANGYTVCQFLKNAPVFQNTPVVILTSRDNVIDRSRAKLVGASDFLVKPPKPKETLAIIQKYLSAKADA